MKEFLIKSPKVLEDTDGLIVDKEMDVADRLTELAKQTNANTLSVFQLAERTANDHRDMELFLKIRKNHARQRRETSPGKPGKNSPGNQ